MPWTTNPKVMQVRQRSSPVNILVESFDGFRRHLSSRNAAVLAYYGFLTLFPLFMAATTTLGFVLEGRPDLRNTIVNSAVSEIPVVGSSISENAGEITGSAWALVIGLAIAVWSSMKAFLAVQSAFDDTWEVHVDNRANAAVQRGRAIVGMLVIGGTQIGGVIVAAVVSKAGLPGIGQIGIVAGSWALNILAVAAMFRFMTSRDVSWSMVWPGAIFAGTLYTVLQLVGTRLMTNTLDNARDVYGNFADTLVLLTWLSLHALIALLGAELNSGLDRVRSGTAPLSE